MFKKYGFIVVCLGVLILKKSTRELRYFAKSEFKGKYDLINPKLLVKLDEFRHRWGRPVDVSPADGSIVRYLGDSYSQHNIDRYGKTNAIDVFPHGMNSIGERRRAYKIAQEVGFTGIGIYTDTKPSNLLHVDVRDSEEVATWSRVDGDYKVINEVLS